MSKLMEIEVKGKTYLLGYPTPKDALHAEDMGLNVTDTSKLLNMATTLFWTGLLAKQPNITKDEGVEIMYDYINENGDLEEVTKFLVEQFVAFTKSPDGTKKKKAKIITM